METLTAEIRDAVDNYRASNELQRILIARDAMQRLFVAEKIWKQIKVIDEIEERIKGEME